MDIKGSNDYHGDEEEINYERLKKKIDLEDTMYDRFKDDDEFIKAFNKIFNVEDTK